MLYVILGKKRRLSGKILILILKFVPISAGSFELGRPDASLFPAEVIGILDIIVLFPWCVALIRLLFLFSSLHS